jgi:hypothetical protein
LESHNKITDREATLQKIEGRFRSITEIHSDANANEPKKRLPMVFENHARQHCAVSSSRFT